MNPDRPNLTRAGLSTMRYGLGGGPIGHLPPGAANDVVAHETVQRAWDLGVRLFDTAPYYGLGRSETRLRAVLGAYPRSSYVVSTKVGRRLVEDAGSPDGSPRLEWDFSRDGVRRVLEASLERLGTDHVDIAYIHDPDDHWTEAVDQSYPALAALRDQGVVGAIGVGMNQWQMPVRFIRETDIDAVLIAGRYSVMDQSAGLELLPLCAQRNVAVVVGGVFNSGLLATDDPHGTYDYYPAAPEKIERARGLAALCQQHGVSLPHAALAFPARHPAVTSVIVGARSADEVERNMELAAQPVPEELWTELDQSNK